MKWAFLYIHPDPILGMPRSYLGYVLVMSGVCLDHSLGMFWSYLQYTLGISWVWWWSHDIPVVVLSSINQQVFLIPYHPMVPPISSREVIVACSVTVLYMFFCSIGIDKDIIQINNIIYIKKITKYIINIRLKYCRSIC